MTISVQQKNERTARRARRNRSKIMGTAERPRLSVHRSLKHISAQLIDDVTGTTVAAATDRALKGAKLEKAAAVGKAIAQAAQGKGITSVVFDRGAYLYHGRVKAVAEAAREAGLQF